MASSVISPRSSFSSTGRSAGGPSLLNSSLSSLPFSSDTFSSAAASTSQVVLPGFHAISTALAHPTVKPNPLRQSAKNAAAIPPVKPAKPVKIEKAEILQRDESTKVEWAELERLLLRTLENSRDHDPTELSVGSLNGNVPAEFFDSEFSVQDKAGFDYVHSLGLETTQRHASTVTMELQRHIALRSKDFFKILSSISELQKQSKVCLSSLNNLRRDLSRIQQYLVEPRLVRLALSRRQENLLLLRGTVKTIRDIVARYEQASCLYSSNKHEALDLIEDIERDLADYNRNHDSARILQDISSRLMDMKEVVAGKYIDELSYAFTSSAEIEVASFSKSLDHLRRCGPAYTFSCLTRIREDTRRILTFPLKNGSSVDLDAGMNQLKILQRNIKSLSTLVQSDPGCVEELNSHLDVYSEAMITNLFEFLMGLDSEPTLDQFSDNDNLLLSLDKQMADMGLSTQELTYRTNEYRKSWFSSFHAATISRMAKLVEEEQWSPSPPTASAQAACCEVALDQQVGVGKLLSLGGREYHLVPAVGAVLIMLRDYQNATQRLGSIVNFIMSRFVEFLKQFNSRTCQVVLGAGAMRSAGLKNITAKHLALASQSLSIMIDLIPKVKKWKPLGFVDDTFLNDLDRLRSDFQEHQYEIHAKLVSIMGDRLTTHIKALTSSGETTKPSELARPWAQALSKETTTLHKVISKYLPLEVVEMIVGQVFTDITSRLSETFAAIELKSEISKQQLLTDARFIYNNLIALKDVTPPPDVLEAIINERVIIEPITLNKQENAHLLSPLMNDRASSPRQSAEPFTRSPTPTKLIPAIVESDSIPQTTPAALAPRLSLAERLRTSSGLSFIRKTKELPHKIEVAQLSDTQKTRQVKEDVEPGRSLESPLQFTSVVVDSPTMLTTEHTEDSPAQRAPEAKLLPSTPDTVPDLPVETEQISTLKITNESTESVGEGSMEQVEPDLPSHEQIPDT